MVFKRLENESDEELIYRICSQKDQIGTWEQVKDVLNELTGNDYGESTYRKRYQAFDKMIKANQGKFYDGSAMIEELKEQQTNLKKERIKLQSEKLELNRNLRELARDELLIEKIEDAISNLKELDKPEYIRPIHNNRSYLLTIADCHFAIEFQIKDFFGNIVNEYSSEIFKQRMELLFGNVIETIEKEGITELNIWNLGDELQGLLRLNSQLMQMKYGVVESAILYAEYMANWLNELSNYVRIKYQMVMDSNHNQIRMCNAPKNAFPDENMSHVINAFLKERLKDNDNITIIENPTGMNYALLSTYAVVGIHGEVKNLGKALNEFSRAYQLPINYIIGGHVHHSESKEVGIDAEALSVKSVIGVDPYGMSLQKTSNAGANLFVFEQGNGKVCEYTYKLN